MKASSPNTKNRSLWDKPILSTSSIPKLLPFLLLAVTAFSGILPQVVVASAAVVIMAFMAVKGNVFLAYPIVVFYYIQLDKLFGVSVFRIFTLLLVFSLLLYRKRFPFKEQSYLFPFAVYILYLALTLSFHNVRTAVFFAFDLVVVFLMIFIQLRDKDKLRAFFTIFVLTALVAFFTGLLIGVETDSFLKNDGTSVDRLMATFNDPNYMGFFYSVAVFATVTLKLFTKRWRSIIVIALYIMMLTSLSMTAIIGNLLFWMIYLILFKKQKRKNYRIILGGILALILIVALYFIGLWYDNIPVLSNLSTRIEEKLLALTTNDLNSFTTNRLNLTKRTLDFFMSQTSVFRILFGGYLANALVVDMPYGNIVAHNDYVDLLVNVGVIGTAILVIFLVGRTVSFYRKWCKSKESCDAFGFMTKIIWLFYAFTLTLFGEVRFLLFFFL